jgi:hypothetical protein
MRPLDFFERKFLFILARAFFLLLVLVAVAASCIGADQFWKDYQQTVKPVTVAPSEVFADPAKATPAVSASAPDGASISAGGDVEAGLHLGFWTTKAISDRDTKKVLDGWLEDLPIGDRQSFLDGLETVGIAALQRVPPGATADKKGTAYADAVNKYKDLAVARIHARDDAKAVFEQRYMFYAGIAAAFVAVISLLSLVLVLLAIERNTRPPKAAGAA